MRRKKVTRPYEEDDGSGPFDSRTGALKDGRSVRVSMMMRDAVPPPSAGARVMYDVPTQPDALVINANSPPMVVDAFGGTEGLNRPGARYLVASHRTTDHVRLVTLAVMRDDAYKTYDEEAQNAWRGETGTTDPGVADRKPDAMPVIDAVEQAYAEYDKEMAEAWRIGK